jgi:hypothetical protein
MAVLARVIAPDMDTAAYDRVSVFLQELLKKQPGFVLHLAYPDASGFYIGEVWESRSQFEAWLTQYVKPNVPGIQHSVVELHAVVQP